MFFKRIVCGECVQTAKLCRLGIGKYAFKTSLFGELPFEINMNMPLFDNQNEAESWILNKPDWRKEYQSN